MLGIAGSDASAARINCPKASHASRREAVSASRDSEVEWPAETVIARGRGIRRGGILPASASAAEYSDLLNRSWHSHQTG